MIVIIEVIFCVKLFKYVIICVMVVRIVFLIGFIYILLIIRFVELEIFIVLFYVEWLINIEMEFFDVFDDYFFE